MESCGPGLTVPPPCTRYRLTVTCTHTCVHTRNASLVSGAAWAEGPLWAHTHQPTFTEKANATKPRQQKLKKSVLNRDQTMWSGTAVSVWMLTTVDITGPEPWGAPMMATSCSSLIISGFGEQVWSQVKKVEAS